jgi:precorrin-2 dehydrogenase
MSRLCPLFLTLYGRFYVVIGGSEMAEGKIRELLEADAKVRVIAPVVTEQVAGWSQAGRLQWVTRVYERGDVRDSLPCGICRTHRD